MAEISITVGPLTAKRKAPDAAAQAILEKAYNSLWYIDPEGRELTAVQKLDVLVGVIVDYLIGMASEADKDAERQATAQRMMQIAEARSAEKAAWTKVA